MTTPELLRAAAGEVRNGWTQGIRHDGDTGNVCALGALENAAWKNGAAPQHWADGTWDAVQALGRVIGPPHCYGEGVTYKIAHWNNAPDQTAENVAVAMEYAALCAEQEAALAREAKQEPVGV